MGCVSLQTWACLSRCLLVACMEAVLNFRFVEWNHVEFRTNRTNRWLVKRHIYTPWHLYLPYWCSFAPAMSQHHANIMPHHHSTLILWTICCWPCAPIFSPLPVLVPRKRLWISVTHPLQHGLVHQRQLIPEVPNWGPWEFAEDLFPGSCWYVCLVPLTCTTICALLTSPSWFPAALLEPTTLCGVLYPIQKLSRQCMSFRRTGFIWPHH